MGAPGRGQEACRAGRRKDSSTSAVGFPRGTKRSMEGGRGKTGLKDVKTTLRNVDFTRKATGRVEEAVRVRPYKHKEKETGEGTAGARDAVTPPSTQAAAEGLQGILKMHWEVETMALGKHLNTGSS